MSSLKYFLKYLGRSNHAFNKIRNEEGQSILYSWIDSIWCFIRYGSTIRQYSVGKFYKYSRCQRKRMLTTRRFFKIVKTANDKNYIKYLENKLLFNEIFKNFVKRRWYESTTMTIDQFKNLLESHNGIIIKPLDGMEGRGIYKLTKENVGNLVETYKDLKKNNSIVEECIIQHPRMNFGNKSVNTIRVITVWDKKKEKAQIIKAILRAGVGNAVVDNFHQGGCAYEVDILTGYVCSKGISVNSDNVIVHPGTDICMLGYLVPNWNSVVAGCLEAQSQLPQCRYISWDVAITKEGIELIEGNHNGDYDMLEFVGSTGFYYILKNMYKK